MLSLSNGISIVFPAYNEEENIAEAVDQALESAQLLFDDFEIIVVNDGSSDRTGTIIAELAKTEPRVRDIHHEGNGGYGKALRSGIDAARKEYVFFCDSDLQFHLSELVLLLAWIKQYDLVIGYRVNRQDPVHRRLNAWGWKRLVRLVLGLKVRDIDCAFKLFRRSVFQDVQIESVGAMVNTEILVQATRMGYRIKEIPVTHFPRKRGTQTGANLKVILKAFRELRALRRKLRNVPRLLVDHDRRSSAARSYRPQRRREERRKVRLCIGFPDRRHRLRTDRPHRGAGVASPAPTARRPLNIAMVVASPYPANHGTPGAARELANAMAEFGHEVHIVSYPFGDQEERSRHKVHRTLDLGFSKRIVVGPTWQKPILDLLLIGTLCRVIRREKIDIIHAINYEGALAGWAARMLTGRPLIYNAINTMSDELPSYGFIRPRFLAERLARLLDYYVPRTADEIVAISEELATFLKQQRIPADRIHVIPPGIDLSPFESREGPPIRERHDLPKKPVVMYTGCIDRFQRMDYLLKAMGKVVEALPEANLVIAANVAKDRDVADCERMIRELGLEGRVRILLKSPFEEVPGLLSEADVAVVPRPDCPGFPVKLLNYMAAARPIVTFEGSAKGLENRRDAIVVKDHDWQAMAQGIVELLTDKTLAQRLAGRAKERAVNEYSWPSLVDRLEAIYNGVLNPKAAGLSVPT